MPFLLRSVSIARFAQAAFLLVLFTVQPAFANIYYVSTSGSDSSDGAAGAPFATIQHASRVTQPGDTVIVGDGTYNLPNGSFNGDLAIASSGKAGQPILYVAAHKWQAKLVGSGLGDGSTVVGVSGSFNVIRDFDVTGTDANGIILATSGTNVSYNEAAGNYVHDLHTPCDSNGGAAIESGGGSNYDPGVNHFNIIGNLIVDIVDSSPCSTTTRHGAGIYALVPYVLVANNVLINAGRWPIESWHAANHTTYFGNTIINSPNNAIIMGSGDSPNTAGQCNDFSLVQNNITYNTGELSIIEDGCTGSHNQYIDNLAFIGTGLRLNNGLQAVGMINADPKFVNNSGTANGNYHLLPSSPAIGHGLALAEVPTDFDGAQRPTSGPTDIGAFLFSPATTNMLTLGITANPLSISQGQSSTLSLTTSNAATVALDNAAVPANVTYNKVVSPTQTTTYTATASGGGVSKTAQVTVNVTSAAAPSATLAANPASIPQGQSTTLSWVTAHAVSASINGVAVALSGSQSVSPQTTSTYTIKAIGSTGAGVTQSVTVAVTPATSGPVAAGISASAASVLAGQPVTLNWNTRNAVSANLNGGQVALNGSLVVTPLQTTTYRITGVAANGTTDWGQVTINVTSAAAPSATLAANPASIPQGQSTTLSWVTAHAVSASINGVAVALSGSQSVSPQTTSTYTIKAIGSTGAGVTQSVTVAVTPATSGPVAAGISASAASVLAGQPVTLNWNTRNAVSANLNGGQVALNGSLVVTPLQTTTYRITGVAANGTTDWGQVTINVIAAPPTVGSAGKVAAGISASQMSLTAGESVLLTWNTRNAIRADLNGRVVALNGSQTVSPSQTTTYRITGVDANGVSDWGSVTISVQKK